MSKRHILTHPVTSYRHQGRELVFITSGCHLVAYTTAPHAGRTASVGPVCSIRASRVKGRDHDSSPCSFPGDAFHPCAGKGEVDLRRLVGTERQRLLPGAIFNDKALSSPETASLDASLVAAVPTTILSFTTSDVEKVCVPSDIDICAVSCRPHFDACCPLPFTVPWGGEGEGEVGLRPSGGLQAVRRCPP